VESVNLPLLTINTGYNRPLRKQTASRLVESYKYISQVTL